MPLYAKYLQDMKAKNLPGDQVLKFAREYLAAARKAPTAAPAKATGKSTSSSKEISISNQLEEYRGHILSPVFMQEEA
jgi:hypothetical protein